MVKNRQKRYEYRTKWIEMWQPHKTDRRKRIPFPRRESIPLPPPIENKYIKTIILQYPYKLHKGDLRGDNFRGIFISICIIHFNMGHIWTS